jgi:hypothetical protein
MSIRNSNHYGLNRQSCLGKKNYPQKTITEKEYTKLNNAYQTLCLRNDIEKAYDLIVENYLEFFKELSSLNLEIVVPLRHFGGNIHTASRDVELKMNRRLINLLATARLYFEFLKRLKCPIECLIKKLDPNVTEEMITRFKFVIELRHTTQHHKAPIVKWNFKVGIKARDYRIGVSTTKKFLLEHKGFKEELFDKLPDEIPIIEYLLDFMEVLSLMHFKQRKEAQLKTQRSINYVYPRLGFFTKEPSSICIFKKVEGTWQYHQYLSKELIETLKFLESKNNVCLRSQGIRNFAFV